MVTGTPSQSCDLMIQLECDFQLSIELCDLNLSMLGTHQLQNAVTAACTALCLCNQGRQLEAVYLTEANIAGGTSRTTSATVLRDCRIQASRELGIKVFHDGMAEYEELLEDNFICSTKYPEHEIVVAAENSLSYSLKYANQILRERTGNKWGILVVTGSLHIVSLVLASLNR